MENTIAYITTRGRVGRQRTLECIPTSVRKIVRLVVDEDEFSEHKKKYSGVKILRFPKIGFGGLSDKRQWCLEHAIHNAYRFMFLLDDDLIIKKREPKSMKIRRATPREVRMMFDQLVEWLYNYPNVGISQQEGNNHFPQPWGMCAKVIRFIGFDVDVIAKHDLRFDEFKLMSDYDMILSLIELGYNNIVWYDYANEQRSSNEAGGCSIYRTPELLAEVAHAMAAKHPTINVVKMKTSKPWPGFDSNERIDVRIGWKKAFGIRKRGNIGKFLK